jgi:uncharacterized protein YaaR (DUF327 family)
VKIKNVRGSLIESPFGIYTKKEPIEKVGSFRRQLENISAQNYEEPLLNLANSIFKQGEVISKRCDIKELKKYKELISLLFSEIVNYGFEFWKHGKPCGNGRQKIYANIRKVNEKLEKLTAELLKEQKQQLLILETVEDIRGLILDIFM